MSDRVKAWLDEYQHGRDERLEPALRALRAVVGVDRQPRPFATAYDNGWNHCLNAVFRAIEKEVFRAD